MKGAFRCHRCGAVFAEDESAGCPACLLEAAIFDDGIATEVDEGPSGAPRQGHDRIGRAAEYREVLYGDYRLEDELARGGMGVVFRAKQVSLDRYVALKMIRHELTSSAQQVQRFHIEAEATAKLRHPNVIPIYEIGEHEGQCYLTMPLIEGGDLSNWAKRRQIAKSGLPGDRTELGRSDQVQIMDWMIQLAEAVEYAHQRGVLHRDLKPSNILLDELGKPYVADFGLAKIIEADSELTVSKAVIGTPCYMAPEQASGAANKVTTSADIYSLGAILYELLSGQPPFRAETVAATMRQVVEENPTPPSTLMGRLDPDLETVCLKCLQKDPKARYASALELAEDLQRCRRGEPIHARSPGAIERIGSWCRRNPVIAGLGACLVGVLVAGMIAVTWQWKRAEARGETNLSQLAHMNLLTGIDRMNEGDYHRSLIWLARALQIDSGEAEGLHRARIASVLSQCPRLQQVVSHEGRPISAATFSPVDDRLATTGGDWRLRLWDAADGREIWRTPKLENLPQAVAFSPDGSKLVLTTISQPTDRVWLIDASTGQPLRDQPIPHLLAGSSTRMILPSCSSNGDRILTQPSPRVLQIWDTETGKPIGKPMSHADSIHHMEWSSDNLRIWSRDESFRVYSWDAGTGKQIPFNFSGETVRDFIRLQASGRFALIDQEIRDGRADSPSGAPIYHQASISWAAFSPDEMRLLTCSYDRTARVWDLRSGRPLSAAMPHHAITRWGCFSPDGHRVLTRSADQFVRVWDADNGRPLIPWLCHKSSSVTARSAFSGSGRFLFTFHPAHLLFVWDLSYESDPPAYLKPLRKLVAASDSLASDNESSASSIDSFRVDSDSVQRWIDSSGRFALTEERVSRIQVRDLKSDLPITPAIPSHYSIHSEDYQTVDLPTIVWSAEELIALAELLSGGTNGPEGWRYLTFDEVQNRWNRLRKRYEHRFHAGLNKNSTAWHWAEAKEAESTGDWNAARFHLAFLARRRQELTTTTRLQSAKQNHSRAFLSSNTYPEYRRWLPPRDDQTPIRLLDLSDHYTDSLAFFHHTRDFFTCRKIGIKSGIRRLAGSLFDVRGVVILIPHGKNESTAHLTTRRIQLAESGTRGPLRLEINRKCHRIHLLHSCLTRLLDPKQEIAKMEVQFHDGTRRSALIRGLMEIGSFWSRPEAFHIRPAQIAWIGADPNSHAQLANRLLYVDSWDNPVPDIPIEYLEVTLSGTSPYALFGVTLDKAE